MRKTNVITIKKCLGAIMAAGLSMGMLAGCGQGGTLVVDGPDAVVNINNNGNGVTVDVANPWVETDHNDLLEATGCNMVAPASATNIVYSYLDTTKMAQMTYDMDGASWTYRMLPTGEYNDISGMYYEWNTQNNGRIAGNDDTYYSYNSNSECVRLVNWFDKYQSVSYSLSVVGDEKSLNGMDIEEYATDVYMLSNGVDIHASDNINTNADVDLNYFLGLHTRADDKSTIEITQQPNGKLKVDISIIRLTTLQDDEAYYDEKDKAVYFRVEKTPGSYLNGSIYRNVNNSLAISIGETNWTYLTQGEVLEGFDN